jgi:regulator of RNase E activity RraB
MRMSDEWRFFMCTMGGNAASIMVDVGIRDGIEHAPPGLATIFLDYKQPDDRGLPTDVEFDAVIALEDRLKAFVGAARDVYVGRITKQGQRIFFVYTMREESRWATFVKQLAAQTGYELELQFEADPEHESYWKYLYPTADDWQVIADMDVVASLQKSGDDPEADHKIEHFAYFPDEESAAAFVSWAVADRFTHDAEQSGWGEGKKYCVRLDHVGPTIQRAISAHTIALRRKAEEFGGEYDGWGTLAVKKGAGDGEQT